MNKRVVLAYFSILTIIMLLATIIIFVNPTGLLFDRSDIFHNPKYYNSKNPSAVVLDFGKINYDVVESGCDVQQFEKGLTVKASNCKTVLNLNTQINLSTPFTSVIIFSSYGYNGYQLYMNEGDTQFGYLHFYKRGYRSCGIVHCRSRYYIGSTAYLSGYNLGTSYSTSGDFLVPFKVWMQIVQVTESKSKLWLYYYDYASNTWKLYFYREGTGLTIPEKSFSLTLEVGDHYSSYKGGVITLHKAIIIPEAVSNDESIRIAYSTDKTINSIVQKLFKYKIDLNTIVREIEGVNGEETTFYNQLDEHHTTIEYDLTNPDVQLSISNSKGFYGFFKDYGLVLDYGAEVTIDLPEEFTFNKNFKVVSVFQIGDFSTYNTFHHYSILSGATEIKYSTYYRNCNYFRVNIYSYIMGYSIKSTSGSHSYGCIREGTYGALVIEKVDDSMFGRIYIYDVNTNQWVLLPTASLTIHEELITLDTQSPVKLKIKQEVYPTFVKKLVFTTNTESNDLDILNSVEVKPLPTNLDNVSTTPQLTHSIDFYQLTSLSDLEQDGWVLYNTDNVNITPLGLEVKRISSTEYNGILLEKELEISRLGNGLTILITGFDIGYETGSLEVRVPPTYYKLYPERLYSNVLEYSLYDKGGREYAQVLIYDTTGVKLYNYVYDEATGGWYRQCIYSWSYNSYSMHPISDLDTIILRIVRNYYSSKYNHYGATIFSRVRIYSGVPEDVDAFVSTEVPPLTTQLRPTTSQEIINTIYDFTQMTSTDLQNTASVIYKHYYKNGLYYPTISTTSKGLALLGYGSTTGVGFDINKDTSTKSIYVLAYRKLRLPEMYFHFGIGNYVIRVLHDDSVTNNIVYNLFNQCGFTNIYCGFQVYAKSYSTPVSDYILYKVTFTDVSALVTAYTLDNGVFTKQWEYLAPVPPYENTIRVVAYVVMSGASSLVPIMIVANGYEEGVPESVQQIILDKLISYTDNQNPQVVYDVELGSASIDTLLTEGWEFKPGTSPEWMAQQFGLLYLFPDRSKVSVTTPEIINPELVSITGATIIIQGYDPFYTYFYAYDPDTEFVFGSHYSMPNKYASILYGGLNTGKNSYESASNLPINSNNVIILHLRTTEQIIEAYTYNTETGTWEQVYYKTFNIPLFNIRKLIILGHTQASLALKRIIVLDSYTTPDLNTLASQLNITPNEPPNRSLNLKQVIDFAQETPETLTVSGLLKGDAKKMGNFLVPMDKGLYHASYITSPQYLDDTYLHLELPVENSEEVTLFIEVDALTKKYVTGHSTALFGIGNGMNHHVIYQYRASLSGYVYYLDENVTQMYVYGYINKYQTYSPTPPSFSDYTGSREEYNHYFIIASLSRDNTQIRIAKLSPSTGQYVLSGTYTYAGIPINTAKSINIYLWSTPSLIRKIYYYSGALDLSQDFNLLDYVTPSEPVQFSELTEVTASLSPQYTLYDFTDDTDLTEFDMVFDYDSINQNYISFDGGIVLGRYCCTNLHYNIDTAKTIAIYFMPYSFSNYYSTFDLLVNDYIVELDYYGYSYNGYTYEFINPAFLVYSGTGFRPYSFYFDASATLTFRHSSSMSFVVILRFTDNFIRVDSTYYSPISGVWETGFNTILPPIHKLGDTKIRINTEWTTYHKLFKLLVSPDIMDLEEIKTIMIGS